MRVVSRIVFLTLSSSYSENRAVFEFIRRPTNMCECTKNPAWRARSAIAKWQVGSEIRTHKPGSRKRGLRSAQRDLMRAVLNHFKSLMDFITHA